MPLRDALDHAAEAGRDLAHARGWAAARAVLEPPWTAAVVGRVGVGKTTFVNRRLAHGAERGAVGLGGVTREVRAVAHPGGILVDTPGIDDPNVAVEVLGPVLDEVDAAVWIVDGLQPMTGSERDVLRDTLPDRIPLWVVVSRIDLVDESEVHPVLERVRELAAVHAPRGVVAADLRSGAVDSAIGVGELPGERRRRRIAELVGPARAAFAARGAPIRADQLVARWRDEVRAVVRDVERRLERGSIRHEVDALAVVSAAAPEVVAALAHLAGDPPLILPMPEPPARTTFSQVVAGLSGAEGARRAVRTVAARWLAAGEIAIRDEWAGAAVREAEAREHERRARAWAELEAELDDRG